MATCTDIVTSKDFIIISNALKCLDEHSLSIVSEVVKDLHKNACNWFPLAHFDFARVLDDFIYDADD